MSDGKKALCFLTAAIVLGGTALLYCFHRVIDVTVPDAYAVWNVADLINDYMEYHDGKWPRGWDDLRESHDRLFGHDERSFTNMRDRVEVNWSADPKSLAVTPEPAEGQLPFRVIWAKSGSKAYYTEPNWLVWNYLHQRTATRPYQTATRRPVTTQSSVAD